MDPLARLRALRARRARLDDEERRLIEAAQTAGASWQDIADALGIRSRQGAQQRYRRLITATEHTDRQHPPRPRPHRRPAGE